MTNADPDAKPATGQSRVLGELARELAGLWQVLPGLGGTPALPAADARH
jgi:hypothetical protein